jgi:hypothetical protein
MLVTKSRLARLAILLGLGSGIFGGARASGQCLSWSSSFHSSPSAAALIGFDDGSGPALYVGGMGVQRWNGSAWLNVGYLTGTDDGVFALGTFNDGSGLALYAAGDFERANFVYSPGIAKWSGSAWLPVGWGLGGPSPIWAGALAVFDDGSGPALYIGGHFVGALGATSNGIIKWDGSTWSSLAGGITAMQPPPYVYPNVWALAAYDDGSGSALYALGNFSAIGGVPADGIAKWNGSLWSAVPGSPTHGGVAMAVYDDGTGLALYLGGNFTSVGGAPAHGLARWDGTSWSVPPGGLFMVISALTVFDDGSGPGLYAGGLSAYPALGNLARWDGANWSTLGRGVNGQVQTLAVFDDGSGGGPDLYVGGAFTLAGDGIPSTDVAEWYGCQSQITPMCYGDGTFAPCPCHNSGAAGHGCQNSAGLGGALLSSTGTTIPDTFTLLSSFEPTTALTIFIIGDTLTQTPVKFGDGIRCAGGNLLRLYVKTAGSGMAAAPQTGDPSISQRSANLGFPIPPGSVRYFQTYYRDGLQSFCPPPNGSSFNVANALRVIW